MDAIRYSIRAGGSGLAMIEASSVGGPSGIVVGAVLSGGVWALESTYDGVQWWCAEMAEGLEGYKTALENGWIPGQ